jgi:hypothetical protein
LRYANTTKTPKACELLPAKKTAIAGGAACATKRANQKATTREVKMIYPGVTFRVEYTVKGARNIRTREFKTFMEAARFAARWRASNSTGHYLAKMYRNDTLLAA